jgi:hypothetical protein
MLPSQLKPLSWEGHNFVGWHVPGWLKLDSETPSRLHRRRPLANIMEPQRLKALRRDVHLQAEALA